MQRVKLLIDDWNYFGKIAYVDMVKGNKVYVHIDSPLESFIVSKDEIEVIDDTSSEV